LPTRFSGIPGRASCRAPVRPRAGRLTRCSRIRLGFTSPAAPPDFAYSALRIARAAATFESRVHGLHARELSYLAAHAIGILPNRRNACDWKRTSVGSWE